jgi:hypothetical protein
MGNAEEYAPLHETIEFYHFKNFEEKRKKRWFLLISGEKNGI